jgi:selenocysteine lyase/cysteine desulfurase
VTFVPNATLGVNTVFRNLQYEDGDYILYFATIYKGCHATVQYITETSPAKAARVEYTYPVEDDWLVDAFKQKVEEVKRAGGKVKVAIFDTVVSMPGVRVPYERLLSACKELGVLSLLDAAHGIGHLDLDVTKLDPDFMTTNCHKYVPRPPVPPTLQITYAEEDGSTSPAAAHSSTYPCETNTSSAQPSPPPGGSKPSAPCPTQ